MKILVWKLSAEFSTISKQNHTNPVFSSTWLKPIDVQQADRLDALTQIIPGGAYTTLRTFNGSRVLHLDDHLSRLEKTSSLVENPLCLERNLVRNAIWEAVKKAQRITGAEDFRIRFTLDLQDHPGDLYLALQPLVIPTDTDYQQGVPVITHHMQRLLPKAKLTRFIQRSGDVRRAMPSGVNETIMVNENGFILEGLSSNFFAVIDGELWTAEEGVLSGITRSLVLEGILTLGLTCHLKPARQEDIPRFQEAFITSSSRAVLPVNRIDGQALPSAPGPITQKLMRFYANAVEASLEDVL